MHIICGNCYSETTNDKKACPFCGKSFSNTNPENALHFNTVLNGIYTVNNFIQTDSEGVLYSAVNNITRKPVIVKEFIPQDLCVLRTESAEVIPQEGKEVLFKTIRMDFKEMYILLQRISNMEDGLVKVLDVFDENNTVYGVCEKIDGPSLREYVLTASVPVSQQQAVVLLRPLAKSIESLHRLGIIHRGISPDSIFISDNGIAVLGGFATLGVRTIGSELVHAIYDGYAAPEQYSVAEFDGNYTDIYALGSVFYFILSQGVDPQPAQHRRREDNLIPLKNISRGIPAYVSSAVSRAMRIPPVERMQSPTELINSIERLQKSQHGGINSVQKIIIASIGITVICFGVLVFTLISSLKQQEPASSSTDSSKDPVVSEPQELIAPSLVGKLYVDVQNDPDYLGKFHFPITEKFDSNFKKGEIMEQSPLAGQSVGSDGVIRLIVSAGPKTALMPDLKGLTRDDAVALLTEMNIKYAVVSIVNDGSLITGTVVRTNYDIGDTLVENESEVVLYIAKEPLPSSTSDESTSTSE